MSMEKIGKTIVGKKIAKSKYEYPMIKLPCSCQDLIGKKVTIFRNETNGAINIVISTDQNVVVQPTTLVAQPLDINERISGLENRLKSVESVLSSKEVTGTGALSNAPVSDGLEEIRTPDLRRVKATS